ncbi:hypothetical protein Esti_005374 [Eimeria stiedai]
MSKRGREQPPRCLPQPQESHLVGDTSVAAEKQQQQRTAAGQVPQLNLLLRRRWRGDEGGVQPREETDGGPRGRHTGASTPAAFPGPVSYPEKGHSKMQQRELLLRFGDRSSPAPWPHGSRQEQPSWA